MNPELLNLLVCPYCKGSLHYDREAMRLICRGDKVAFPICDGIPMMLESAAVALKLEELPK
ncbi:MAG: Trm112 family protein [Gammaproteobacteria bacterium]|nr:Trm112 family protein [Gammaproteobacteria bacterium]MCP4475178.1 Trm112 family protein [Gammaproteobacteria bacterium]